jgi:hypothetical protein
MICAALLGALGCKSTPNEQPVEDETPPRSEPWPNPLAASAEVAVVNPATDYHKSSETIDLAHYSIAVGQIKNCTIEPYLRPKSGSTVLGIELKLTGKGPIQVPSNPFYATLVGPDGARYAATLAGCKPELAASSLDQGDTARGFVSFVVPEGHGAWKLVYRPTIIGALEEEARFDLAR